MPKRSDLKVPPVVSDLYWDLRDRRLLPIVALLVVAIIAAPILLNGGSNSSSPTPTPAIGGTAVAAKGTQLTVVAARPGLRNPKQRFAHRKPTDPFKQRFTTPQVADAEANAVKSPSAPQGGSGAATGAGGGGQGPVAPTPEAPVGGGGGGGGSTPSPTLPSSPNGPTGRGGSSTGEGGAAKPAGGGSSHGSSPSPEGGSGELRYYLWTAKIQIAHTETKADGSTQLSKPEVRESVKSLTPLPGAKKPVVTFIGVDPRTENGLFVVSKEVTAMYGEAKCISGTTSCEVVELETGFPETFEYGPGHVRWKLKVLATQMVRVKGPGAS